MIDNIIDTVTDYGWLDGYDIVLSDAELEAIYGKDVTLEELFDITGVSDG